MPPRTRYAEAGDYNFEEGDAVRILSGPFADLNGTVSEVNVDQSSLMEVVFINILVVLVAWVVIYTTR